MTNKTKTWWADKKTTTIANRMFRPNTELVMPHLFYDVLNDNGSPIFSSEFSGTSTLTIDDLIDKFVNLGGKVIIKNKQIPTNNKDVMISWDVGAVTIAFSQNGNLKIDIAFRDEELYEKCNEILYQESKEPNKGDIHTLIQEGNRMSIQRLCATGKPLEKLNYTPKVAHDYDTIVSALQCEDPRGRILIIDGPPGTGKTYFLRALINDVQAKFVLVPPNMLRELTGPQLLPILFDNEYDEHVDSFVDVKPTKLILVIEDADECLVPRQSDNIGLITTLLNLGDGILGHALDLRIIATTNAKVGKIDPAILRPGRLLKRIEINKLNKTQSEEIYNRLTGKPINLEDKQYSLAEIYDLTAE